MVQGAVDRRRAEFATVRSCARTALAKLGVPPAPILPGERGAPQWPAGVVGSMTHCDGYRAAVLARREQAASIGVDAEPHAPLPDGVLRLVARPEELDQLQRLAECCEPEQHWDRLLFTMKESVYKAWFPLTGRWLDFQQASVRIDPVGWRLRRRPAGARAAAGRRRVARVHRHIPDRRWPGAECHRGRGVALAGAAGPLVEFAAGPPRRAHGFGGQCRYRLNGILTILCHTSLQTSSII